MMSLFNSFDCYFFSLSILASFSIFLFLLNYTHFLGMPQYLKSKMSSFFMNFFYSIKPNSFHKSISYYLFTLMFILLMFNILGMLPYSFAVPSRLSSVLMFSFPFWLIFFSFNLISNIKGSFSHFIPEGAPLSLSFFLFLVEIISILIRPITLTVRLVANIVSGHLLMILLCSLILSIKIMFPLFVFLNLVEIFVGLIQSYIFCTMCCLYYSDVH